MTTPNSHSRAVPIRRNQRNSFLDAGGPNSINEFANSYSRIQSHLSNIIIAQEHAPTVPSTPFANGNISPSGTPDLNTSPNNNYYGSIEDYEDDASEFNDPSVWSQALDDDLQLNFSSQNTPRGRQFSIISRYSTRPEDRTIAAKIEGKSTAPQTIFNSINILIGVGLYSLSFGFKYSGLVYGVLLLLICGLVTGYSAILIGRCLKLNNSLLSYGDLAYYCYGSAAFIFVVVSFSLDLIGAAVALILLFSNSFHTFFPNVSEYEFQIIYCAIILVISLFPLNVLAKLSFIGIICTTGTVVVCVIAGLLKPSGQGSLISPSPIYLFPLEYKYLFVSLGIFLALFGGHAVFPELYQDMRHPAKFSKSITVAFSFTVCTDMVAALIGYLMFGNDVDEIMTNSIMTCEGYPKWIPSILCFFLGLVPLTKGPLVIRPVATVLDQFFNVYDDPNPYHVVKIVNKTIVVFIALLIANACTSFAQVMAVMGSLICFTICITLPVMFYYKMYYDQLPVWKRRLFRAGICLSIFLTITGTYAAIVF